MTLFFSSHEIQIYRKRRIGSSNRWSMSATLTAYQADIQPASLERTEFVEGRVGAVFDAYVEQYVDIKEGDQVIADGKRYSVRAVTNWDNAMLLDHKALILVALDG